MPETVTEYPRCGNCKYRGEYQFCEGFTAWESACYRWDMATAAQMKARASEEEESKSD